jgi:regulator of cell morphogenesis and NO signaling
MKQLKKYEPDDKMITLIKDDYSVLQALGSFGINLGFGDMTVAETCKFNRVDTYTFLAVVNYTINDHNLYENDTQISVETLLRYLKASHLYYLDFQLPTIRRELEESMDENDPLAQLIMKLYDGYAQEIRRHMKYEEKTLFPYVESLLQGSPKDNYTVEMFSKHHENTDKKLREVKLMIIKYLPSSAHLNNKLTATLYDIYNNEEWLKQHAEVEDHIFTPAIRRLEQQTRKDDITKNIKQMVFKDGQDTSEVLSDRERDIIIGVVQGMQNKEIADSLNISVNTVITHRRNIARKLQIHSAAGLTIYAIVNGLVDISSVKL